VHQIFAPEKTSDIKVRILVPIVVAGVGEMVKTPPPLALRAFAD
jgi:hypothetical protein